MTPWLMLLALAAPPEAQADFTAANERALQGDHRAAIALYESLLDRGVNSVDVLYNLGNAYAKSERLVDAVIAYERALRLSPGDEDVAANLTAIRNRLAPNDSNNIGAPDAPLTAADALAPWVVTLPSPFAAMLLLLGNGLFWFGLWVRERRVVLVSVGAAIGFLGVLFVGAHAVVAGDPVAIVRKPTTLREGPRPQFRANATAPAGTRVRIIGKNGAWREVQRGDDGTTGWLPINELERL